MPAAMLTVTMADVKRLCAIDAGDTSQDADISALLAGEQAALEYGLDPAVLAASLGDAGLAALLTLGAAECLAGSYLEQSARAPGMTDDFRLAGLELLASRTDGLPQLAARLAARGKTRLEPFARAPRQAAADAVGGVGDAGSKIPTLAVTASAPSVFDHPFDAPFDGRWAERP